MSSFKIIAVILLSGLSSSSAGSAAIVVEVNPPVATNGSNVTITCRIKDAPMEAMVHLYKMVIHNVQEMAREMISSMHTLMEPYKSLGRYYISKTTDGSDLVYKLQISAAQYEDSGEFACYAPDHTDEYSLRALQVYKVPEEVIFLGQNESGIVTLNEKELTNLTCVTPFVMPHPTITVWAGPRLVTDRFLLTDDVNVLCANIGDTSKTCPLHCNYNVTAKGRLFRPVFTDDEKNLTCRARMRHFDHDVVETHVIMDVRYAPKIICPRFWKAPVNSTSVRFTCVITANPPASYNNKTWIVHKGTPDEMRLLPNHISAEYTVEEEPVNDNPKMLNMSLTITVARPEFFDLYVLEVSNEIGTESKNVRLLQSNGDSPSSAQKLAVGSWVSAAILLMTSLHLLRNLRSVVFV